jgi:hypothetical protein
MGLQYDEFESQRQIIKHGLGVNVLAWDAIRELFMKNKG